MKKIFVLAIMALSFVATTRTTQKDADPIPMCDPCPF
jgi:hypothetical protein